MPIDMPPMDIPIYLQPCASCGSPLQPRQINLTQQMYLCADQECPYPLNSGQVSSFLVEHAILNSPPTSSAAAAASRISLHPTSPSSSQTDHGEYKTNDDQHYHPPPTTPHAHLFTVDSTHRQATLTRTHSNSCTPLKSGTDATPTPIRSASAALAALKRAKPTPRTTPTTAKTPVQTNQSVANSSIATAPSSTTLLSPLMQPLAASFNQLLSPLMNGAPNHALDHESFDPFLTSANGDAQSSFHDQFHSTNQQESEVLWE